MFIQKVSLQREQLGHVWPSWGHGMTLSCGYLILRTKKPHSILKLNTHHQPQCIRQKWAQSPSCENAKMLIKRIRTLLQWKVPAW